MWLGDPAPRSLSSGQGFLASLAAFGEKEMQYLFGCLFVT